VSRVKGRRLREIAKHGLIWFVLLFAFFPLYVTLVISFKTNAQFANEPFLPTFPLHWENWGRGWTAISGYIANSVFVSVLAVILTLVPALMSSFVFARYRFPGREVLWYLLLGLLFMPGIMNLVPLFTLVRDLSMLNSLLALSTLYAVAGQVFTVFVLRNFIEEIPPSLFEAAQVDGAGPLQQIRSLVVPMSGSILATLAILRFLQSWNGFVMPLVMISDDYKQVIPVGLMRLDGEYVKMWGQMMAGFSIAAIPLVLIFLFTMRLFVRGLTAGAVKG
jgi:ABC-type glycerol-3-phosphate transport system permease component